MAAKRIVIAASGSGGHLLPATFVGRAIEALNSKVLIEYIGGDKPLEKKIFEGTGKEYFPLHVRGIKGRGIVGLLQGLVQIPWAFLRIFFHFVHKRPALVVGIGGYATVTPVLVAKLLWIPVWIHEAEEEFGLANRFLSCFADRISAVSPELKASPEKLLHVGYPVNPDVASVPRVTVTDPRKLLILGGSQGARSLDEAGVQLASFFKDEGFEIWHQCRPEHQEMLTRAYKEAQLVAKVSSFIEAMPEAYEWADLILSRAGAGAVTEIGIVGRPVIFVPFPFAQGGHQLKNAKVLTGRGVGEIVEEGEQFEERLSDALRKVKANYTDYLKESGKPSEATSLIAEGCLKLAGV